MFSTQPQHADSYRARTDSMTSSMANIGFIPTRCKCAGCGKMRTEVTGKRYADGTFLGDCCKPKKAK